MTINQYIKLHSKSFPKKKALIFEDKSLTYSQIEEKVNQTAFFLHNSGLTKKDKIGVLMPNCPENITVFLGILKAGCIEVNFNPDTPIHTIIKGFKESEVKIVISSGTDKKILEELSRQNIKIIPYSEIEKKEAKELNQLREQANDWAMIQYTSGSTGEPKGVVLTQKNFIRASRERIKTLLFNPDTITSNMVSLSHSCGRSILFDSIVCGCTMVLMKGFISPAKFLKSILETRISIITGPPYIYHYLIKLKNNKKVISQLKEFLKFIEIGLSSPPPELILRIREAFPWVTIINRYGVTENAGAASIMLYPPDKPIENIGSCGRGTAPSHLEINDPDKDNKGKVLIKGDALMVGYLDDIKEGKNNLIPEQGFVTEDVAKIDSNGYFYVLGRDDDIMKVGGERISPQEIEDVILKIPQIDEAIVFSIQKGFLGEQIVAYYTGNAGEAEIKNHCKQHLPSYMMPHFYVQKKSLSKKTGGKVKRRYLREEFLELQDNPL